MDKRISKLLLLVSFLCLSLADSTQAQVDQTMEDAVASLRNISGEGLSDQQKEAKAKQIDEAWKYLISAGPKAAARLKQEIQKVDTGKEKDDFFKLNAAVVLWNIGKANEADYIAKVWESTPIAGQYTYVFLTAFEAARSQDPKVLPMLRAILKDDRGSVYVPLHAMNVGWPLSHEFIWGVYGPKGLAVLADILEKSNDEVELKSAMVLLARAQYLPSLARIRQLTSSQKEQVRRHAIQVLGVFGHPADYDFLVAGLRSTDAKEQWSYVFALYEFDDLRPVPLLIPLLEVKDENLQVETFAALLHLLTPDSFAAAKRFASKVTKPELKELLDQKISFIQQELPAVYEKKTAAEKARLLAQIRNKGLVRKPNDPPFTNQQLLTALRIWKEKGRIYRSGFDWVGEASLIAAAEPENIEQMLDTKAAFYRRLSDECLYEVRDFDKAIKYIGRSRYRKGVGVTDKAELK